MADREEESRTVRFERHIAEHGPAMWRLTAGYARHRGEREDLYQDILLALWKALPGFRGDCSERTFAYRVGHNRGITHRARTGRRQADPLPDEAALADPSPGPQQSAVDGDRLRRLQAGIRRLPAGHRQVVMLSLEGLPQRQIGEVLGISEGNVAVRLNRARARLRRGLEEEEKR